MDTYWPENDAHTLYIPVNNSCVTVGDLIDQIHRHWPGVKLESLRIEAENIHTHCINYDLYDPMDYTNFVVIHKDD